MCRNVFLSKVLLRKWIHNHFGEEAGKDASKPFVVGENNSAIARL